MYIYIYYYHGTRVIGMSMSHAISRYILTCVVGGGEHLGASVKVKVVGVDAHESVVGVD